MVINTNVRSLTTASNLNTRQGLLAKSLARLSSGSKNINPSDDAAGGAAASRLNSQIKRTDAAKTNVINAISFAQTQDGYLTKVAKALDRMGELSLLAQDVTKGDSDRALYNTEFSQLASYIATISTKEFNGVSLFSANTLNVTIDSEGSTFPMTGIDLSVAAYTDALTAGVSTAPAAAAALDSVKNALNQLASDHSSIGAFQARLDCMPEQLIVSKENLSAASSRLQDTDEAEEATQYARYRILIQAGTALLTQANQLPKTVLRLIH